LFNSLDVTESLKAGGYAALALFMFVANFIQINSLKTEMKEVKKSHTEAMVAISKVATAMSSSTEKLADSFTKVLDSQRELLTNQQLQSNNQLNQTHALNEVVRELIGIIREGDRG
jgi:hypothetical protein